MGHRARNTVAIHAEWTRRFLGLGVFSLGLIFAMASIKARWVKVVPPQVFAAVVGLVLGWFLGLNGDRLILIPEHPFQNGFQFPHFYQALADHSLWLALATTILTLTLIDGVESLATIAAIDKIDPFRRKSDPNRTLSAMGISNLCSSLAGGLTIIPGGVKSTTGILSRCAHAVGQLLQRLFPDRLPASGQKPDQPDAYDGFGGNCALYRLQACAPKVWKHVAHIGSEQLFVFTTTVLVTVSTDLLWGIAAGIAAKLIRRNGDGGASRAGPTGGPRTDGAVIVMRWLGQTGELFRDPVIKSVSADNTYHMYLGRPVVCFNSLHLHRELCLIPRAPRQSPSTSPSW